MLLIFPSNLQTLITSFTPSWKTGKIFFKYSTKFIHCHFYFLLYPYFITGLKYICLLIICNYCVQPTYGKSSLPIYLSTNLQSSHQRRPPIVLQSCVYTVVHDLVYIKTIRTTFDLLFISIKKLSINSFSL